MSLTVLETAVSQLPADERVPDVGCRTSPRARSLSPVRTLEDVRVPVRAHSESSYSGGRVNASA